MIKVYTNCLREDVKLWKKEVGASYEDIASIVKCSKSHLYEFLKGKKNINYELGKVFEMLVTWDVDVFARYKAKMIIDKLIAEYPTWQEAVNSPEFRGEK